MNPKPQIFLIAHGITLLLSLFVIIPMGLISTEFSGYCLLYAKGNVTVNPQTNKSVFNLSHWGSSSNCNYVLFVGILMLLTSAGFIWNYALLYWKEHDKAPFGSFVTFIANGVVSFCIFISALIISVGFHSFCEDIFNSSSSPITCSAADVELTISNPDLSGVNTGEFFTRIHVAEFGVWTGWLTWVLVSLLAFCKVYYYHKNDDLLSALAVEKRTLLNRNNQYQQLQGENTAPPKA